MKRTQRPSPLLNAVIRPSLTFQPDTREQFLAGIGALADMLAFTLGPTGGPVMSYDATRHKVEALDDAATTLRRILGLGRPDLDAGAMLLRGVIWRLDTGRRRRDDGDRAAVLPVEEGMRQVTAGANAMRLNEGMRRGAALAIDALRTQSRPVAGERDLAAVAVMQDDDLAAMLGEMSYLLGADGHWQIESTSRRIWSANTWVARILQRRDQQHVFLLRAGAQARRAGRAGHRAARQAACRRRRRWRCSKPRLAPGARRC